jgi:hypothetical protein
MFKNEYRGKPCVCPRAKTEIKPIVVIKHRAYVQFRGSEFHTRNARFRQPQEQRRAKAHSRQAMGFSPTCSPAWS